jgi:uncharacterized protein YbaR (Trm112 family)
MDNGENTVESGENTIESGLSVSVESSPRTPIMASGGGGGGGAPLKKVIQNWRRANIPTRTTDDDSADGESISPRVLFPEHQHQHQHMNERITTVRRRLDFSTEELSPIIASSSSSPPSVGICNICYDSLPVRANHVFTMCGHLYCVKCFLTWWKSSITCPMCRAKLLDMEEEENDTEIVADTEEEAMNALAALVAEEEAEATVDMALTTTEAAAAAEDEVVNHENSVNAFILNDSNTMIHHYPDNIRYYDSMNERNWYSDSD